MSKKKYIITGSYGMDGSFLCESLLKQGHEVVGVCRRSARQNSNLNNCYSWPYGPSVFKNVKLDITDASGVSNLIREEQPDIVINTAAASHVGQSFKEPVNTLNINGAGVVNFLEAIRVYKPDCRFLTCSTSEMFGNNYSRKEGNVCIQDENTTLNARSPYGASKIYAHHMVQLYRSAYNLHASTSICFNHDSSRRGLDFVTRKITNTLAQIKHGYTDRIRMGTLDTYRDIGHALDYITAMDMIVNHFEADDYVIATGEAVSVRQMLEYVCELADLDIDEIYELDPKFLRPAEVNYLCGDSTKIRKTLDWKPTYNWQGILKEMYEYDLELVQTQKMNSLSV